MGARRRIGAGRRIGVRAMSALTMLVLLAGCTGTPAPAVTTMQTYAIADRAPAPQLTGELLDGGEFRGADHAGDVIVVNFWGSWCPPCRVEADDLEQTYLATKEKGVTFVGINVRDTRDAARSFALGTSTYPSIFDPESRLALGFEVPPTAIPSTIIIDRQGRVAMITRSTVLRDDLERLVTQVAQESQ